MDSDERDDWDDPDALRPDRFHVISDAGSVYLDDEHPGGFETAEAAAAWAAGQAEWPELGEFLADGVSATIVFGREVNQAMAAWQAWADAGGGGSYPEVEVHNYAIDLGLVTEQ